MRSNAHKLVCSLVITTILNSSFQPLYAVTFNQPKTSEDLSIETHQRPSLLALDDFLQEKVVMSAHMVQSWTPGFVKNPLSSAYESVCSWFGSKVKEIAPSILAKNPFEIDYAHDLNYWQAHFTNEIEELKNAEFNPERLGELQNIVWSGLLSPYHYEQGLKELKGNISQSQLKKISKRFKAELKSAPELLRQNVRRDLVASLGNIHGTEKGIEAFKELLAYYQPIQNALDNTESLVEFTRFIQKNRDTLKLDTQQYSALNKAIANVIKQRDSEEYRELRKQRQLTQSALQELPYYNGDIFEDTFNSALPSAIKKDGAKESASLLKGLTRLAYKGIEYAATHPIQAITIGLASQVAAAAALNTLKMPEIKTQSNKSEATNEELLSKKEPMQEKSRPIKRDIGDEFMINQNATLIQSFPSITSLTNGNAFVVWYGTQTGDSDIYGRIFSADGMALSDEFTINQNPAGFQGRPSSVASLTNGNAFVAWYGYNPQAGNNDIYGRIFSPNGTALANEFPINQNTTFEQYYPSVASLTNGNAFVAWRGDEFVDPNIYGRVFFPNGTGLSDEFMINQNTTFIQYLPSVARLANGKAFVIWYDRQGVDFDIYGRIFSENGTALTNEFPINQNTTSGQYLPSVASLTNGNAFVIWNGDQTGNYDIYGRIFSDNGMALSDEFTINQNTTSHQVDPSVASLINGNAFVTWEGYQTGDGDIYGRLFSPNGTALTNEFPINQNTTSDQELPSVAGFTNGNAFVAWKGYQTGYAEYGEIYGRIFTNDTLNSLMFPSTTGMSTTSAPTTASPSTDFSTSSFPTTGAPTADSLTTGSLTTSSLTTAGAILTTQGVSSSGAMTTSPSLADSSSSPSPSNTPIIIGATVGSVVLIAGGSGVVYYLYTRNKYFSKHVKWKDDVELNKLASPAPFAPADSGFTEHPTFIGAIKDRTYAIWKELSETEAKLLQPFIAKKIPPFTSSGAKVPFQLGKGKFGATYAGSDIKTKSLYAIKEVYGREAVDESLREGEIQDTLKESPQVISLVDYKRYEPTTTTEQPRLFQVMPLAYINGVGYKHFLSLLKKENTPLHEAVVTDNFQQLMKGVDYMHANDICHLDIKDENILYMLDGTLRIADFGRAKKLGNNGEIKDSQLGDRRKFSPEVFAFVRHVLKQKGYAIATRDITESFSGKAADTWAAGLYILELWLNEEPFSDAITPYETKVLSWTNASFEEVLEKMKSFKKDPPSFASALRQVLAVEFKKRMRPDQAVKELSALKALTLEERTKAFEGLIKLSERQDAIPSFKPAYEVTPSPKPTYDVVAQGVNGDLFAEHKLEDYNFLILDTVSTSRTQDEDK